MQYVYLYICIFIFHLAEKVHSLITLKRYVGAHINVITDIQMYVIFHPSSGTNLGIRATENRKVELIKKHMRHLLCYTKPTF